MSNSNDAQQQQTIFDLDLLNFSPSPLSFQFGPFTLMQQEPLEKLVASSSNQSMVVQAPIDFLEFLRQDTERCRLAKLASSTSFAPPPSQPPETHSSTLLNTSLLSQEPRNLTVTALMHPVRETIWEDIGARGEHNSLPFKYTLKLMLSRGNIHPHELKFELVCLRKAKLFQEELVPNGIGIDRFRGCKLTDTGSELLYQIYFTTFSHAYDMSKFVFQVVHIESGSVLFRSKQFKLFARRKREKKKKRY